jgi:hypothetical protein
MSGASRRQFLGAAAALSSLPVPREVELTADGGAVDGDSSTEGRPERVDATFDALAASAHVERYTDDGGVHVRSYPHQPELPVEITVETGVGTANLGLEPDDARRIGRRLLDAAGSCDGSTEPSGSGRP